jgi:diguanylate cyclase (GGDEF)-like protein
MKRTSILEFVDSALKDHHFFNYQKLKEFSRKDLQEALKLLLMRVENRESELNAIVESLKQSLYERTRELTEKNQILEELVIHDQLTQIYNRRFFDQKLEEYSLLTIRINQALSCIMADIDHFKDFNDTYGHQAGDFVLRNFALILKENIRRTDICARYGGEEFVVLLPNTTLKDASRIAEKIRIKIAEKELSYDGKVLRVTVSFGVAMGRKASELEEVLVRKADIALYKAKLSGRNKVCNC